MIATPTSLPPPVGSIMIGTMLATRRWPLAVALAAATAWVPAQERRPLLGTVVDAGGKPLARATVQVAFVPLGAEHTVAVDHATATTDERGRFRVDVLPCAPYRLWATGPLDEAGGFLASGIATAAAGQLVELRAATRQERRCATMKGGSAWTGFAPLRLRVLPGNVELPALTFALGADERVELPPLPFAFTTFEILDKDGEVLRADTMRTTSDVNLPMPKPQDLHLLVVDDKGAPVAGATIRSRTTSAAFEDDGLLPTGPSRTHWRTLGTSDAEGRLLALVACQQDPFEANTWPNLFLVAHKSGYAASASGISQGMFHDGRQIKDAQQLAKKELRFTLRPQAPWRARVVVGDRPLAQVPVTLRTEFRITMSENNGWMNDELVWHRTTDAEGRIEVADLPPDCHETVVTIGADARNLALTPAQQKECALHPVALHRFAALPTADAVFDLATLTPLHLRVLDEGKAPARDASILLISRATGDGIDGWAPRVVPNATGHATVLLQPGAWSVFARNETCYAFLSIDGQKEQDATLELAPMPSLRGKVVDADGKPVAGLQLQGVSMSVRGMAGQQPELNALAQSMCWSWIQRTRTGADGTFDCRMLSLPNMRMKGRFQDGQQHTEEFVIAPGDEPVTLVIQ